LSNSSNREVAPFKVEQAADQQEGERTDHRDDPDSYAAPLLKPQILRLHPSGQGG
jgi:hypothetical protein